MNARSPPGHRGGSAEWLRSADCRSHGVAFGDRVEGFDLTRLPGPNDSRCERGTAPGRPAAERSPDARGHERGPIISDFSGRREPAAPKLFRGDNAHHSTLRVENCHWRDGLLVRRKHNSFPGSIHRTGLLSRKRATKAHMRPPQAGHGSLPISKHVSESRHGARRPNGRCDVVPVTKPFTAFIPF